MCSLETIDLQVPAVFRPLWKRHARYKGAWGGRGSGKSHDRATACVVEMMQGERLVGVREIQRSIKDSVKQLVEDKIYALGVRDNFEFTRDEIRHASGGRMTFQGLQDHSAESIKSLEGVKYCWVEEAQTITQRSMRILTPTIRVPGSELWFTWNPRYDHDPVDVLLRGENAPEDAIVVRANWIDNPWFPDDLKADMFRDKELDFELYEHIWEGGYQYIGEGAYYATQLARARSEGRVCTFPIEADPPIYTGWDLGIDDVTAIWAAQPVGRELHIVDFYQDHGREAAHYARWCRDNGYTGTALLPHDAGQREKGTGKTYAMHLREAGLQDLRVLPQCRNLMDDIQQVRSFFPRCWFHEVNCKEGLKALGAYRVEMDEKALTPKQRPRHDWASHPADAFRALSKLNPSDLHDGYTNGPNVRVNLRQPGPERPGFSLGGYDRRGSSRVNIRRG